ncbi:DUF3592 domain-containing protein [candidate division WOR-3 bacterium]|nr:DUF3592 domain-containing protein [candidate division WOR-3 bacterium]
MEIISIVIGLVLILIGSVHSVFSLWDFNKDKELMRKGRKIVGRVKESVTYPQEDDVNTGQHKLMAEFLDSAGRTQWVKSRFATHSPELYINKEVYIVCDPDNPKKARFLVDTSLVREVVENLVILIIGVGLFLFGVIRIVFFNARP